MSVERDSIGAGADDAHAHSENERTTLVLSRRFLKSLSIYAVSSFLVPLSGLILVPFLTHELSRNDYGAFAVLTTLIALVAGITQLGLGSAFLRAYTYDYSDRQDRAGVVSHVFVLLMLISVVAASVIIGEAPWLASVLFNTPALYHAVKVAGVVILLQNLMQPGYIWLRAEDRAAIYSGVSILNLAVTVGATVGLVGFMHMGISGALISVGCGYISSIVCTFPLLVNYTRLAVRLRLDIVKNLLSFGLPLVPGLVSIWVLQLSDRYLLGRFASLTQAASYSVSYTLGGILGVVVLAPFLLAWPTSMYTIAKQENAAHTFRSIFRWYSLFLLFATGCLLLASRIALYLLFPPAYYAAAPVIPTVALSIVFYGVYQMFSIGASIQRKTWLILIFTSLAALLNVGANLLLIPLYGMMGAALATLGAYAFLAIIAYIVNQRIYFIPFEIGMFAIALACGIAFYLLCDALTPTRDIYRIGLIYMCALIVYGGCLFGLIKFAARREARHSGGKDAYSSYL